MVIISNSSRRASVTTDKMKSLGFDPSLFLGSITSGELTHLYLERRDDPWFAELGRSCIHITWSDRGAISLDGLDLKVVDNAEEAEFILAHGTEGLGLPSGSVIPKKLEELEKILEQCAVKKIPMVVANPDCVTVEVRALRVMPGTLASKYEKLGGEVKWMGKPAKVIYESAMALAGVNASECIAVGDSLHHDIKGSNSAGMNSIFITGGIHADELGLCNFDQVAKEPEVRDLATKFDAYPTYVMPSFTWRSRLGKRGETCYLNLPPDHISKLILRKLKPFSIDYFRFGGACKQWRTLLMEDRRQIDANNRIPMMLVPTSHHIDGYVKDPFAVVDNVIRLPPIMHAFDSKPCPIEEQVLYHCWQDSSFISKKFDTQYAVRNVVLSADPRTCHEYLVIAIYGPRGRLAFFKANSNSNNKNDAASVKFPSWIYYDEHYGHRSYRDVAFDKGLVLACSWHDAIVLKVDSFPVIKVWAKIDNPEAIYAHSPRHSALYLSETMSTKELLLIAKVMRLNPDNSHYTWLFLVFKLVKNHVKDALRWVSVSSLDGDAIFVGSNHTVSVIASDSTGHQQDSIYFTDDHPHRQHNLDLGPYASLGPHDMGIYNLRDTSKCTRYTFDLGRKQLPQPFWILPMF
ncbi:hypothetical protein KSS87_007268 [Heliosperma pusillum]|nr:hypothetical protein KSS87_007268 [Heliosperma pusillum]